MDIRKLNESVIDEFRASRGANPTVTVEVGAVAFRRESACARRAGPDTALPRNGGSGADVRRVPTQDDAADPGDRAAASVMRMAIVQYDSTVFSKTNPPGVIARRWRAPSTSALQLE